MKALIVIPIGVLWTCGLCIQLKRLSAWRRAPINRRDLVKWAKVLGGVAAWLYLFEALLVGSYPLRAVMMLGATIAIFWLLAVAKFCVAFS